MKWLFLLLAVSAHAEPLFPFVLPWDNASTGLVNVASWSPPVQPVTVADGHFVAGKERIRFLGVNFCFGACFPEKEAAGKIAARLAKFGINIARFHHMDMQSFPNGIWAGPRQLSPEALERLDYFIAQLQKHGIYANLNLLVSRRFAAADGLPAEIEALGWKERAVTGFFHGPVIELQKEYARQLLTHRNSHTGKTYAEDPGVGTVEIHNENGLIHAWLGGEVDRLPATFLRDLQLQWNVWLRRRYGTTEKLREAWNARTEPLGEEMLTGKWRLEQHDGAQATVTTTNDIAELHIQQAGSADWHVQWNLPGLMVLSNQTYTLTFRAKADAPRTMAASVGEAHEPWGELGLHGLAALTNEWRSFRFVFAAHRQDVNARVNLTGFGLKTGRVWISDVSLRTGGVAGLAENERFENATLPVFLKSRVGERTDAAQRDWFRFLWETEDRYWQGMQLFLKSELKVQAPIIGTIVGCSTPNLMARLDAVDTHAYWQHPHFPGKPWDAEDWTVGNKPMTAERNGGVLPGLAFKRVLGKPHCVTEYNHPAPNSYSAEAFPLLAAYAALQDWDAIYVFAYSHRRDDWDTRRITSFFDIDQHPLKMATLIPAAALFRRADVKPAPGQVVVPLDKEKELDLLRRASSWRLVDAGTLGVKAEEALTRRIAIGSGNSLPGTSGEFVWSDGVVTVNTPRSKAVIGASGGKTYRLGNVVIEPGTEWSVITATELQPGRWLVTACGNVENTGMVWKDATKTSVGRNWGQAPSLVEGVKAKLTFPGNVEVWALDEQGQRRERLPGSEIGPQYRTIWYEVVVR
jgi:hypothetical protein